MIKITTSWAILSLAGLLATGCTVTTTDDMQDGGGSDGGGSGSTGSATTGTTGGTDGSTSTSGGSTGTSGTTGDGGATAVACCPMAAGACADKITACQAAPSCAGALGDFYNCLKTDQAMNCEANFAIQGVNMDDAGGGAEVNALVDCLDNDPNNCPAECSAGGDAGAGGG